MSTNTKPIVAVVVAAIIVAAVTFTLQFSGESQAADKVPVTRAAVKSDLSVPTASSPPVIVLTPPKGVAMVPAATPVNEPRLQLQTAIPDIIRLLEDRDYLKFATTYMPPDQMAEMPEGLSLEQRIELLKQMPDEGNGMLRILKALQVIQNETPTMEDGGNRAFYKLDPPVGPFTGIVFVKVKGLWYLQTG